MASGRFLCRADILAAGADPWANSNRHEHVQYFRRLKLEEVSPVPRPSCLPEGPPSRNPLPHMVGGQGPGEDDAHCTKHGTRQTPNQAKDRTFEVSIPLGDERVRVEDFRQSLKTEYAARYLEQLGASPTPANVALLLKHLPFEECKIQETFHPGLAKNENKNFITIRPMAQGPKKSKEGKGSSVMLQDLNLLPLEPLNSITPMPASGTPKAASDGDAGMMPTFEECKGRFVHPFNLPPRWSVTENTGPRRVPYAPSESNHSQAIPMAERRRALVAMRERAHVLDSEEVTADVGCPIPLATAPPSINVALGNYRSSTVQTNKPLATTVPVPSSSSAHHRRQPLPLTPVTRDQQKGQARMPSMGPAGSSKLTNPSSPERHRSSDLHWKLPKGTSWFDDHLLPRPISVSEACLIAKEIDAAPDWRTADMRELMTAFLASFPFDQYSNGLGTPTENARQQRMMDEVKTELQSERFCCFLQTLTEFMYWTFLAPLAHVDCDTAIRDARFLEAYEGMLSLVEAKKSVRQHIGQLPILLLALRTGLEAIMRRSYPTWSVSPEGVKALQEMDKMLLALLDPMAFLSQIPPIEAMPEALRVMHCRKAPGLMPATYTSPLVRFIVAKPSSRDAKALLSMRQPNSAKGDDGAALHRLSPELRGNILALMARCKLGLPQPNLLPLPYPVSSPQAITADCT